MQKHIPLIFMCIGINGFIDLIERRKRYLMQHCLQTFEDRLFVSTSIFQVGIEICSSQ